MEKSAINTLSAIRETKKQQIETYFGTIRNQIETFAQDLMIISAMKEFKKGFNSVVSDLNFTPEQMAKATQSLETYYRDDYLTRLNANVGGDKTVKDYFLNMPVVTKILQYLYISNNPNPVGEKDNLDNAGDGSTYSAIHAKYHPIIREYLKKFKYYDIFLLDIETGTLMYTCYKEVDFTTSLLTGPFKDTNFAKAFLKAQEAQKPGVVSLLDFEFYDPSYGAPASFISTPIFDKEKKIGVLIFQMPIDEINRITTNNHQWEDTGLGKTGEVFLVGPDYKMRSNSRFLIEDPDKYFSVLNNIGVSKSIINKIKLLNSTILVQEVNTQASREVIRGNTNTIFNKDYRHTDGISAFTPIKLIDFNWGLISEIDTSEILQPLHAQIWILIIAGLLILCAIAPLSYFFYTYFL
jgi:methyl-accepting chemotaxis protein